MRSEEALHGVARTITDWAGSNPRSMPWLHSRDPYHIWLSEIILQQTQVSQGIPYYEKFLERFPSVHHLAEADEAEVLKAWQGLGYNSRARHLHAAARQITSDYGGRLPGKYEDLLRLKGVGPYTAAAVASFAFGERVPVIDSNVIRVLCRYLGIRDDPSTRAARRKLQMTLQTMIARVDPAAFNQAIMNFGALQCTPRNPGCTTCPLKQSCMAYNNSDVDQLPVKKPRRPRKVRFFHYFVITDARGVLLRRRTGRDIWRHMFDFPCIETPGPGILRNAKRESFVLSCTGRQVTKSRPPYSASQQLTHQHIHCRFYRYAMDRIIKKNVSPEYYFVDYKNLKTFALPKIIDCYFKANSIHL